MDSGKDPKLTKKMRTLFSGRIRMFLVQTHLRPKGNHPSKFQLIRVSRFGGVREQKTNPHTNSLTSYCFIRRLDLLMDDACRLSNK